MARASPLRYKRAVKILAVFFALVVLSVSVAEPAGADENRGTHAVDVEAFADIMADERTAADRCMGLVPDWSAVAVEHDRLRIQDIDYFTYRKKASERAAALEEQLSGAGVVKAWCEDALKRYGPAGTVVTGAIHAP